MKFAIPCAALLLSACASTAPVPQPEEPTAAPDLAALPALLTDRAAVRMEALPSGTLTREGSCLYLQSSDGSRALILWGDADVRVARLDPEGWLVNNYTTGQRFREGVTIRGGGGYYPADADLRSLTQAEVPSDCTGPAVQLYDVKRFDPANPNGIPAPPPPPPRTEPWRSSLLDRAFDPNAGEFAMERRTISGIADPREALFVHVLEAYRGDRNHKCLTDVDDALLARLSARFGTLYPGEACGDDRGRVVLRANNEGAMAIHAQVDCSGNRGFCAGAAGYVRANLGAEANAYRLRRKGDGWEIERLGIGVIS